MGVLGDRCFKDSGGEVEEKVGELSLDGIIGGIECQLRGLSWILLALVTSSRGEDTIGIM